ncbi:alpha-amylase [Persicitalea jodogahamensis]|uniref:Alpha-amylase n=1 Tax=Persicitalea jodogahamensis TaxID=402147 RepID=A0A8J3D5Q2_9BACT|nr:alpha-amylase [Persicitalea jodogahamensis]
MQDLGVEAIWLTPIQPSSTYHKYDVMDYYGIDPEYGTMDDFRRLLDGIHRRGMKLYMDLVVNHTSILHPWFEQARSGANNPYRNFYWWMTPAMIDALGVNKREETADAHVIFPWHKNPGDPEKYYAMFWEGMPDLNYESEALREEIYKIVRHWLTGVGVDGFRLDAARHIYPPWLREKNIGFWEEFGQVVKAAKPDAYTVGEVWAKASEVAPYFKGLKANFHFDLSFAIQRIIQTGKDAGLVEKLLADYDDFGRHNIDFIDATMLTNHDQNRIGSVAGGNVEKMKLAAAMLLTLPGQPYLYYGEEIGMLGVKPDHHIREPFLWTDRPDDPGRTRWMDPLYSRPTSVRDAATQLTDEDSLLNHYRKLIALRKAQPALSQIQRPNLVSALAKFNKVVAYIRTHPTEPVLVVHNIGGRTKKIILGETEQAFKKVLFQTTDSTRIKGNQLMLPAYGSIVLGK